MSSAGHLFVTGASSGIGAAVVRQALAEGWRVSGCARRQLPLQALAKEAPQADFLPLFADVTDAASLDQALAAAYQAHGAVDVLIANAGHGMDGELTRLSAEDLAEVANCNLLGVHRTLQASLPFLAPQARFLVVSSIVAFLTVPRMAAYCASKHALESWVRAARMELAQRGIRVCSCCPGTVDTPFFEVAAKPGSSWHWRPGRPLSSQTVARALLRQARRGRPRRLILPASARLLITLDHFLPALSEAILSRALQRMRRAEQQHPCRESGG